MFEVIFEGNLYEGYGEQLNTKKSGSSPLTVSYGANLHLKEAGSILEGI